jgi:hypothetical protein
MTQMTQIPEHLWTLHSYTGQLTLIHRVFQATLAKTRRAIELVRRTRHPFVAAACTIAVIPTLMASGSVAQASMMAARSRRFL